MSTEKIDFEYDGFYFNPHEEGIQYSYFKFNTPEDRGDIIQKSDMGFVYHILLWYINKNDEIVHDEVFEAVLVDPYEYIQNLNKSDREFYGCIVKKTTKSDEFVENYIDRFHESVKKTLKLLGALKKG